SAGFDKNAEVIKPILNMGFSFTELGTVTPLPQKGNPKPRIFRFPKHQALVNSLGFNNKGLDNFERNIVNTNTSENFQDKIIGINIGNNKDTKEIIDDLEKLFDRLYRLGDYIVINLSSPNTPGLRDNLKSQSFEKIVNHLHKLREKNNSKIPILFKISPDISEQEKKDIALISLANDVDGLILTNTSIDKSTLGIELNGGISGRPLFYKSNKIIRDFYTLTSGKIKIIGVGGIFTANDILTKMKLGASLVQLYSSFTYQGPYHIRTITLDLMALIQQQGFRNISEVIGQHS
ncbi:MAG: quinone-dependent dihydroorotate dehydrogenase, partial [Pelagibacteraceae bacterium]